MLDKSDDSLTRIYNALADPIRRRIVQILRENGTAGYKELLDALKISVGALYQHLDSLEGLVAQGIDRKYFLTDEGRTAIDAISSSGGSAVSTVAQTPTKETRLNFYRGSFFSGELYSTFLVRTL